ncbi:hypothetical protein QVD99_003425 [Batrachochytrium dendrobatidis]|nr:hypothetical protein QVD99_003425 [Batrachochytrium dendrobatidis]
MAASLFFIQIRVRRNMNSVSLKHHLSRHYVSTSTSIVEYIPIYHAWRQKWFSPSAPIRKFPLSAKPNIKSIYISDDNSDPADGMNWPPFSRPRPVLLCKPSQSLEPFLDLAKNRSLDTFTVEKSSVELSFLKSINNLSNSKQPLFESTIAAIYHDVVEGLRYIDDKNSFHSEILARCCANLIFECAKPGNNQSRMDLAASIALAFVKDVRDSDLGQEVKSATMVFEALVSGYDKNEQLLENYQSVMSLFDKDLIPNQPSLWLFMLQLFEGNANITVALKIFDSMMHTLQNSAPAKNHIIMLKIMLSNVDYQKFHKRIDSSLSAIATIFEHSNSNTTRPEKIDTAVILLENTYILESISDIFEKLVSWDVLDDPRVQVGLLDSAMRLDNLWRKNIRSKFDEHIAEMLKVEQVKLEMCLHWFRKLNRYGVVVTEDAANLIVKKFVDAKLTRHGLEWAIAEIILYGSKVYTNTILLLLNDFGIDSTFCISSQASDSKLLDTLWNHYISQTQRSSSLPTSVVSEFARAYGRIGNVEQLIEKLKIIFPHQPTSQSIRLTLEGNDKEVQSKECADLDLREFANEIMTVVYSRSFQSVNSDISTWESIRDIIGSSHVSPLQLLKSIKVKMSLTNDIQRIMTIIVLSRPSLLGDIYQVESMLYEIMTICRVDNTKALTFGLNSVSDYHLGFEMLSEMDHTLTGAITSKSILKSIARTIVTLNHDVYTGSDVDDAINALQKI